MMKAIRLARSTLLPPLVQAIKLASLGFMFPIVGAIAFIYAIVYVGVNFGDSISSAGGVVDNALALFANFFVNILAFFAVLVVSVASALGSMSPFTIIIVLLVLILMRLGR